MANSSLSCGVCNLRHVNKPPIVWCTECDEGLCTECKEHHCLSKASRSHCVVPFTEYMKLPANVLTISKDCTKHNKKYQMYCQNNEFPCCSKCILESHNECRDFVDLDQVIQNVKTSNAICELEETLVEVAKNLEKIRQDQQDNLAIFKESRKEIEKEIKKTRIKINNHLDKLQEDSMKKLYAEEEKENSKICQLLSSLEKKKKEIEEYQRNIVNIKQHATDLQVFLSMKKIEEDVNSKNKFLKSLEEGKNFNQISLSYEINTSIKKILSDIRCFGEVRIETKSREIVLIRKKVKQAQTMVPTVQSRYIENITLTKQKTIDIQNIVYGCCILPDGRIAFTLYTECKVIVFNLKGLNDFEVKLSGNAFDIVYNSEDHILAVTSGGSFQQCITIIDLEKKLIKNTISLDSNSYGIALTDNRLIYSARDKGIRMMNLNEESISTIVWDTLPVDCHTATFRDNLYHTNNETNTVICYNLQGEIQWTFHNENVLKNIRGIDVDSDGNVYVVGTESHNLVVISPDGQRHREVLTESDGLSCPLSLHYSGPTNQLLVANHNQTAHMFIVI